MDTNLPVDHQKWLYFSIHKWCLTLRKYKTKTQCSPHSAVENTVVRAHATVFKRTLKKATKQQQPQNTQNQNKTMSSHCARHLLSTVTPSQCISQSSGTLNKSDYATKHQA